MSANRFHAKPAGWSGATAIRSDGGVSRLSGDNQCADLQKARATRNSPLLRQPEDADAQRWQREWGDCLGLDGDGIGGGKSERDFCDVRVGFCEAGREVHAEVVQRFGGMQVRDEERGGFSVGAQEGAEPVAAGGLPGEGPNFAFFSLSLVSGIVSPF